jgi:hypothetical protein
LALPCGDYQITNILEIDEIGVRKENIDLKIRMI